MTEHEKQELAELQKTFETAGWLVFMRRHEEQVTTLRLTSWNSIKTQSQLDYMKGFLDALEGIVNYDKMVEAAAASVEDGPDTV